MMFSERIAIIGAGFSGLGAAAALKRHGIPFDVLEADTQLGGNWYHGVYETVHIISSRKTTEYSDYPMPENYPDFPSAAQMLAYLNDYANHYQLRQHIQFNTRVNYVAPANDDCWELTLSTGEKRVYGGVIIANGHHWDCRYPQYPGSFAGAVMHSKEYKRPEVLRNKRVLVVGGGNSACDIAVEAARFAQSSHISMRRGYWFLPKTIFGKPTAELMQPWLPVWAQRLLLRLLLRVIIGKYENYGLQKPDHKIFEHHPTINSELLYYLKHGRICPHPDITRLEDHDVVFVDGKRETFDLIIYATGYHASVPFLAPGVITWKNGVPQLIGGMLAPKHKNIYFFGMGQPRYGAGPLITAAAETLCTFIKTQKQLKHPLGYLLHKMGAKPPETMLADPFQVLRGARRACWVVPKLVYVERLIAR
jgi:hypothetical protein